LVIQIDVQCKVPALHNFSGLPICGKIKFVLRVIAPMFNMWPCKRKLDEEKSKHDRFGLAKWFWGNIFTQDAKASKRHCKP
jgi:hypothetical protein